MDYSNIGKRIKEHRLANKMNKVMLAEKTGISDITIYFYESGRRLPGLEPLIQLSNALNVSPEALLFDYVDNPVGVKENDLLNRVKALPQPERDEIMKIMEALVSAAG